jgi:hypothetical protein
MIHGPRLQQRGGWRGIVVDVCGLKCVVLEVAVCVTDVWCGMCGKLEQRIRKDGGWGVEGEWAHVQAYKLWSGPNLPKASDFFSGINYSALNKLIVDVLAIECICEVFCNCNVIQCIVNDTGGLECGPLFFSLLVRVKEGCRSLALAGWEVGEG